MRGRERVRVEIADNGTVEKRLLRPMDGGVIRGAGVEPWLTISRCMHEMIHTGES